MVDRLSQFRTRPSQEGDKSPTPLELTALLSDVNAKLDDWNRKWTWDGKTNCSNYYSLTNADAHLGSYDAITLCTYRRLTRIYGEHLRLCLNSLSLNLLDAKGQERPQDGHLAVPCLARASEAAVALVRCFDQKPQADVAIRFGGEASAI